MNDCKSLVPCPVKILSGVPSATQADLKRVISIDQPFLEGPAKRRAMGDRFTEHMIIDVSMGINVNKTDRPMFFSNRPQHRQGQCVVSTKSDGNDRMGEDIVIERLYAPHGIL